MTSKPEGNFPIANDTAAAKCQIYRIANPDLASDEFCAIRSGLVSLREGEDGSLSERGVSYLEANGQATKPQGTEIAGSLKYRRALCSDSAGLWDSRWSNRHR